MDADTLRTDAARMEFNKRIEGYIHTCYLWSIVSLAACTCAKQSARQARRTLFYVQAVDIPKAAWPFDARPTHPKAREMCTCMLQVPNLTTAKRLPGIVCVHENMPIRITANVLAPWAVQDSTGVALRVQLLPPTLTDFAQAARTRPRNPISCSRLLWTSSSAASSSAPCRTCLAPNT